MKHQILLLTLSAFLVAPPSQADLESSKSKKPRFETSREVPGKKCDTWNCFWVASFGRGADCVKREGSKKHLCSVSNETIQDELRSEY